MPNNNSRVQLKYSNLATYNQVKAAGKIDLNTIYFCTDAQRIFVGETEYTRPVNHGTALPTSFSPADSVFIVSGSVDADGIYYSKDGESWEKIGLLPTQITNLIDAAKTDVKGSVVNTVTAKDKSITVGGTATAPTVKVAISADAGNALTLAGDGLKVVVPAADVYAITKDTSSSDYAAVYHLTKNGTKVDVPINIPKDMVVESGEVKTYATKAAATTDGMSASQADKETFPGTFIKLTISNKASDKLFINVSNLIEYVTSGSTATDMVVVNVSADHKVTATLTDGKVTLAKLEANVQTKINQAHTHANKTVIDDITAEKVNAWDDANSKKHTHTNKTVLDGITSTKVTAWDNAATNSHTHANKSVLDGITSSKVSAWDAKQDALQFMTAPSATNKVATKADLDAITLVWSQLTV